MKRVPKYLLNDKICVCVFVFDVCCSCFCCGGLTYMFSQQRKIYLNYQYILYI